jgi:hypothetical protein
MGPNSSIIAKSDFLILHFYPAKVPNAFICYSLFGTTNGMTLVRSLSGLTHFFLGFGSILPSIIKELISKQC